MGFIRAGFGGYTKIIVTLLGSAYARFVVSRRAFQDVFTSNLSGRRLRVSSVRRATTACASCDTGGVQLPVPLNS